jgi:hypothetical protein
MTGDIAGGLEGRLCGLRLGFSRFGLGFGRLGFRLDGGDGLNGLGGKRNGLGGIDRGDLGRLRILGDNRLIILRSKQRGLNSYGVTIAHRGEAEFKTAGQTAADQHQRQSQQGKFFASMHNHTSFDDLQVL